MLNFLIITVSQRLDEVKIVKLSVRGGFTEEEYKIEKVIDDYHKQMILLVVKNLPSQVDPKSYYTQLLSAKFNDYALN